MKNLIFLTAFAALFTFKASAQNPKINTDTAKHHVTEVILTPPPSQTIPIQDIAKHIGDYVTVCDKVYTARTFEGSNMTLLNLGGNHPNELLTVMIKGENRSKFKEQPEVYYNGKDVCVSGKVIEYKGKPEIEVTELDQLTLRATNCSK